MFDHYLFVGNASPLLDPVTGLGEAFLLLLAIALLAVAIPALSPSARRSCPRSTSGTPTPRAASRKLRAALGSRDLGRLT